MLKDTLNLILAKTAGTFILVINPDFQSTGPLSSRNPVFSRALKLVRLLGMLCTKRLAEAGRNEVSQQRRCRKGSLQVLQFMCFLLPH